jgi:hypothetical protein
MSLNNKIILGAKKATYFIHIHYFQIPMFLLITFAVCTVLLIAVHMLALMISTCILPNVEAVANLHFQVR